MARISLAMVALLLSATAHTTLAAGGCDGRAPDPALRRSFEAGTFVLNGTGTRSLFLFDIYQVSLYLTKNVHHFADITESDASRLLELSLCRDVSSAELDHALVSELPRNLDPGSDAEVKDGVERLRRIIAGQTLYRAGQVIQIFYGGANQQTRLYLDGLRLSGDIEGKHFNNALLAIWLGRRPVDERLKLALLGNS